MLYLLWFWPHPVLIQHIWNNATKSTLHLPQITEQMKTWNEIELDFKLIFRLKRTDEGIILRTSSPSFMPHCMLDIPRQWDYYRAGQVLSYRNSFQGHQFVLWFFRGYLLSSSLNCSSCFFSLESSVQPSDPLSDIALSSEQVLPGGFLQKGCPASHCLPRLE